MTATTVMLVAIGAALVGRWAHNQPTATVNGVVQTSFALVVIALLDQGQTAPVARGFAWLFLAAVLLSTNSPLTGIAAAVTSRTSGKKEAS